MPNLKSFELHKSYLNICHYIALFWTWAFCIVGWYPGHRSGLPATVGRKLKEHPSSIHTTFILYLQTDHRISINILIYNWSKEYLDLLVPTIFSTNNFNYQILSLLKIFHFWIFHQWSDCTTEFQFHYQTFSIFVKPSLNHNLYEYNDKE